MFIHSRREFRTLKGAPACPRLRREASRTGRDEQLSRFSISLRETAPPQARRSFIFWNGEFLSSTESPVLSLDSGLLRGSGLFETMRAYQGNIIYFNQHIARISNSCKILELKFFYNTGKIQKIINRLLGLNSLQDANLRLTLWKTNGLADILLVAKKYKPLTLSKYKRGCSVGIARLRQDESSFLAQHKTTSRLIYEVNFDEAQKRGFDEAIMLNQHGLITEGTRSNLFFIKKKTLFTPALSCGCLNGITRRVVCGMAVQYGIKLYEGKFTLEDLSAADEAFLTNSLIGLVPVACVEKKYFIKGAAPKTTGIFIRKYRDLLRRR